MTHSQYWRRLGTKARYSELTPCNAVHIMNSQRSLWSERPLTVGIAALVCYAGVFNDVIGVEEMASRLGVSGQNDFHAALDELRRQGRIIVQDGFAGLPGSEDQIASKASRIAMARRLIASRLALLRKIGRSPIIQCVGICGSLAAGNPVRDRNHQLDLDLFLIARHPYVWLNRILFGLRHNCYWRESEPALCPSYFMDASHLVVTNRNFYTASEIRNLIPVSGLEAFRSFLRANSWADYYYPGLSGDPAPDADAPSGRWADVVHNGFFVLYAILRSIRRVNMTVLKSVFFKTGAHHGLGPNLSGSPYGGYQTLVQRKFNRLAEAWFPDLLNAELIDKLFPDELSSEIKRANDGVPAMLLNAGIVLDYSKYA